MIELVSKEKCCGCSSCYNACKVGAISMETDETGFWFPQIDISKCIKCGACERACPAKEKYKSKSSEPKAYIVQNKNDEVRRQSTSGGAFTGIAKQVILQGGVVFGAAIDNEYKVSHTCVDNESDLGKFRNSKYVQSWIGGAYTKAENFLRDGRQVCFSGTPCQIQGLKKFLSEEYENLITVDVMCRAVPSPKVLNKYLEYQRENYPDYDRIVFRDKAKGYSYSSVALYKGNKVLYCGGSEYDPWLRLFLGGFCNRESCHECLYQNGVRASDITLWDCWDTHNYVLEWDDNKGTTNVIAWTEKGKNYISKCENDLRIKEIGIDNVDARLIRKPLHRPEYNRTVFFTDIERMSARVFIGKYAPLSIQVRAKRIVRNSMHVLHIHDSVRKIVHKIRKVKKERT